MNHDNSRRRFNLGCVAMGTSAIGAALLPGLAQSASSANAAAWPTKPIRVLVGYPAGSAPDVLARTVLEPLGKALGQPFIVESHTGAAGNIALDMVSKATDAYTLGVVLNGNLTTAKLTNPNLGFDPVKDLSYLSLLATAPMVLVTQPDEPKGKAFFDAARAAGDTWNYGSLGTGSASHLWMELMKLDVPGIDPRHIPFNGAQQLLVAMIGGQVQMGLLPPGNALPQVRAGKLQAIGVAGPVSELAPGVPPLVDAGVQVGKLEGWTALVAPASFPAATADRISALLIDMLRNDVSVRQQLFAQGWQAVGSTPSELRDRATTEAAQFSNVVSKQHITLE